MISKFDRQVADMKGAYSAIFTPYDSTGAVNFDILTAIAECQLSQGIQGLFVTGSTGEGLLLSETERVAVVKHMVQLCRGRATVIAHVGHASTNVATELARQSADVGADWISSVAPIYHGATFEGALRHYTQIAAASDLPFMIYSLNSTIDPRRDVALFEIPNVCGLKYTGSNFFSVQQLARNLDREIALMSGFDEQFVAALSFGFHGGIGTTFNFAPKYYADIFRLYHEGNIDQAARLQAEINKITSVVVEYENWSYRKAVMRYIGFDCGPFRPPYAPISDQEYEAFAKRLDQQNVLRRNEGIELLRATVS